jgi:cytochrome c oxidase subunit 1
VTSTQSRPVAQPAAARADRFEWLVTTDHKRIGLLLVGTGLVLFYAFGAVAMTMRTQLARPNQHLLSPQLYNQLFTLHGTGMIALVVTPIALGLGVYLVPLQIGAPTIAGPRTTLFGYWLYIGGALSIILGCAMPDGADSGWWGYLPLANSSYSPGPGQNLWILGVVLAACGMLLISATLTWTILTRRAPGMTMMRLPVFTWSMLVTCFMGVTAFPSLLAAMGLEVYDRIYGFNSNFWNVLYEHMFWFYGHPVVYIMFFPFVGCVAEVLATFTARRFFAYKGTVLALLAFAAGSMAVWGHHMFVTGQVHDNYYSLTSNFLAIPAGVEYFGFLGTLLGGRLRYRTPMLFALAFIPQFLIGGLTGIMVADPTIDYHVNDSYFVVAHFHYTLLAGSLFGFFAGLYFWLPKATGIMYSEKLGRLHFLFMVIGTNLTFLPMFGLGILGMPRRVASYPASMGIGTLNLISTIGAFILGFSLLFFIYNVYISARRKVPAPPDPWLGTTLEWATSSPPPRFNFNAQYPVPRIRSYAPLLDIREERAQAQPGSSGAARLIPPEDS